MSLDDDEDVPTADALEMMAAACLSDETDNPMPELAELLNEGATAIRQAASRIAELEASLTDCARCVGEVGDLTPALIAELPEMIARQGNLVGKSALRVSELEAALDGLFARLDHPGNGGQFVRYFLRWPEVEAARAARAARALGAAK